MGIGLSLVDDEDAVRVILLFALEIIFMGREEFLNVPLHILTLAEDFLLGIHFHKESTCGVTFLNVVKNHAEKKDPKKMMTYNLNGFVWALKDSIRNLVLLPTSGELKEDWLVRSQYYFNGEDAPFIQSVKPKCSDFQRCDYKVVDYVKAGQEDFPRLENVPVDVSKVIDTLTTTFESARKHAEVVKAEVVNCEANLVECPVVKKDVGVLRATVVSCEMNLVDCLVVQEDISDPKNLTLKADKFVEPAQVTNDKDDYMDNENDPPKYCLYNLSIGIEEDTQKGELTVSLYEEQIANENSDFDKLLKDGNMNLDKLIANVTKSENKSLQMIKASEVNVVKGDGKPQRPTTPQVKKKRKRFNNLKPVDFLLLAPSVLDGSQETLQPFKEHMNVWIDLLWRFRAPNADWSIVDPHFCPFILFGQLPFFYASNKRYPVSWSNVEKVYFPLNQPQTYWALLELQIRTGVITVYDSMAPHLKGLGGVEGPVEELEGVEGPGEELKHSVRSSFYIKYPHPLS
ncbi:phospholipase-like protein [Tanacetum coccineum]